MVICFFSLPVIGLNIVMANFVCQFD
jgi:hypothetical protein